MSKIYSVKDVAKALGFSTNTVYKYLVEGKIKATRLGKEGRFRVPEAEMRRLLGTTVVREDVKKKQLPQGKMAAYLFTTHFQNKKVYSPDLFDWFLSLMGIFVGIVYFLFPPHYYLLTSNIYETILFWLKLVLIGGGTGLMLADIFCNPHSKWHWLTRILLSLSFLSLAGIFFFAKEIWIAQNFVVLGSLGIASIFWRRHHTSKFLFLAYFFFMGIGLELVTHPVAFFFADLRPLIYVIDKNLFLGVWCAILSVYFGIMFLSYYRFKPFYLVLIWIVGGIFYLLAIHFLGEQSWGEVVVYMLSATFLLILPFHDFIDDLPPHSSWETLMGFGWLVTIVSISLGVAWYTKHTFHHFVVDQSQKRVETASGMITTYIEVSTKLISSLGQSARLEIPKDTKNEKDISSWEEFLKIGYDSSTSLRRLVVANSEGMIIASYPIGAEGTNIAYETYFQEVLQRKTTIISDITQAKTPVLPQTVYIAQPILNHGANVTGVLIGVVDMPKLVDMLLTLETGESGYFMLIDRGNRVILHPDETFIGKKVAGNPRFLKAVNGSSGSSEGFSDSKKHVLQNYAPVKTTGWIVIIEQLSSEVFKKSSLVSFSILLVGLLSGIGALMMTIYLEALKKSK